MKKKTVSDSDIKKYLKIQKHNLSNIYSQEEVSRILSFMRNDIYDITFRIIQDVKLTTLTHT